MTRAVILLWALGLSALAQQQQQPSPPTPVEPPEEDASLKEKEYALNPVQAEQEFKVGNFYAKKSSWRAAALRFAEAVKWNPGFADAHYRLAEMHEKMGDGEKAREAWSQFLEAAPDDKRAAAVKKKLGAKPAPAARPR